MPRRDAKGLTLSDAHRLGMLICVTCNLCRSARRYTPADMIELLGDHEIDRLYRRLPCEGCGKTDYMEVLGKRIEGADRVGLVVRRLEGVRIIRRAIWREETL